LIPRALGGPCTQASSGCSAAVCGLADCSGQAIISCADGSNCMSQCSFVFHSSWIEFRVTYPVVPNCAPFRQKSLEDCTRPRLNQCISWSMCLTSVYHGVCALYMYVCVCVGMCVRVCVCALSPLRLVWVPVFRGHLRRRRLQTPKEVGVVRWRGGTEASSCMYGARGHTPASTPSRISWGFRL